MFALSPEQVQRVLRFTVIPTVALAVLLLCPAQLTSSLRFVRKQTPLQCVSWLSLDTLTKVRVRADDDSS